MASELLCTSIQNINLNISDYLNYQQLVTKSTELLKCSWVFVIACGNGFQCSNYLQFFRTWKNKHFLGIITGVLEWEFLLKLCGRQVSLACLAILRKIAFMSTILLHAYILICTSQMWEEKMQVKKKKNQKFVNYVVIWIWSCLTQGIQYT